MPAGSHATTSSRGVTHERANIPAVCAVHGSGPSLEDLLLRTGAAVVLGFIIFVSYWLSHAGTIYSQKFNVNLVVLTVLTASVMTVISNNIALSLGMVGALSIVRFRTAIKEPLDIAFLFGPLP